jgi:hypothetical protein
LEHWTVAIRRRRFQNPFHAGGNNPGGVGDRKPLDHAHTETDGMAVGLPHTL